jgi:CheY-like chemotaxis protein
VEAASILVADDQATLRQLVGTLLMRTAGWRVREAVDGEHAVRLAGEHTFDLVILDQRMPGLTGIEVARALRDEGFDGPIILFSAELAAPVLQESERLRVATLAKLDIAGLPSLAARMLAAA